MINIYTTLAFFIGILAVKAEWSDCEPVDYDTWQPLKVAAKAVGRLPTAGPLGPRLRTEDGDCTYLDIGADGFAEEHPDVYHGYVAVLQEIVDKASLEGIVAYGDSPVVGVKMPTITQAHQVADDTAQHVLQGETS